MVALVGNKYKLIGFDFFEEDWYGLTSFEAGLAGTEAGKRLMRVTKERLISVFGQCLGIAMSFLDVRYAYDYLKASFDVLRDQNTSILGVIKSIEEAYEQAAYEGFQYWRGDGTKRFDCLVQNLPDRNWIE